MKPRQPGGLILAGGADACGVRQLWFSRSATAGAGAEHTEHTEHRGG